MRTVSDILFSQCAQVTKLPKPDFTVSEKDESLFVPDSEKPTVLTLEIKSSTGWIPISSITNVTECTYTKQNVEDAQIEAKAEELFYIFHRGDETRSWGRLVNKSGFRAIARHIATPQTDVQKALDEALKSERELRAELEAHQHNSK